MDYKLIAIDLDGTLLNSKSKISKVNKESIKKTVAAGVKVVICSGRPYQEARKYAIELGIDAQEYLIDYGGSMIQKYDGEIIYQQTLRNRDCEEIANFLTDHKVDFHLIDNQGNIYDSYQEWTEKRMLTSSLGVLKFLMNAHRSRLDKLADLLHQTYDDNYFVVKTSPKEVELCPQNTNKGTALERLIKYLKFSPKQVIAMGDMDNDLPMMKVAGLSIAMDNAAENVKNACDETTADNDHNGVSLAIEKHLFTN